MLIKLQKSSTFLRRKYMSRFQRAKMKMIQSEVSRFKIIFSAGPNIDEILTSSLSWHRNYLTRRAVCYFYIVCLHLFSATD